MSQIKIPHFYKTTKENYFFVHFNLCVFRHQTRRQNVLNWMVASVTRLKCALNFLMNQNLICYYDANSRSRCKGRISGPPLLHTYMMQTPREDSYEGFKKWSSSAHSEFCSLRAAWVTLTVCCGVSRLVVKSWPVVHPEYTHTCITCWNEYHSTRIQHLILSLPCLLQWAVLFTPSDPCNFTLNISGKAFWCSGVWRRYTQVPETSSIRFISGISS
jgi:hypothetical protein